MRERNVEGENGKTEIKKTKGNGKMGPEPFHSFMFWCLIAQIIVILLHSINIFSPFITS